MFSDDARRAAWDAEVHAPGGGRYALRLATRGQGRVSLLLNGTEVKAVKAGRDGAEFAGLALQPGRNTLVVRAEQGPFDLEALEFVR